MIFEDEAVIRIKNSPIAFKARDIFEVIAFLKFMMRICGNEMEKCDFNNLLKNKLNEQKVDLMKILKERFNKNKEDLSKINIEYKNILDKRESESNKKKNNLKLNHQEENETPKGNVTNNFIFKEKIHKNYENFNNNTSSITQDEIKEKNNHQSKSDKEIQDLLDYEFKLFKVSSSVNEYENFYNNGMVQKFLEKYYYEGI